MFLSAVNALVQAGKITRNMSNLRIAHSRVKEVCAKPCQQQKQPTPGKDKLVVIKAPSVSLDTARELNK